MCRVRRRVREREERTRTRTREVRVLRREEGTNGQGEIFMQ